MVEGEVIITPELIISKRNKRQLGGYLALNCLLYVMILHNKAHFSTAEYMSEDKSKLDDEHLLKLINNGDNIAFSELVRRHTIKYYRIAYRVVFNSNDAEDIVQEAFLKIWKNPQNWDSSHNVKFTTWFYKVVINLCLDFKKRSKAHVDDQIDDIQSDDNIQDGIVDMKQQQELVDKYISELPHRQQIALNLCFYEGVSNKEAAEIMDINIKALQSLIMRAKINLKEKLQEYYL